MRDDEVHVDSPISIFWASAGSPIGASLVVIAIGMVAVYCRGEQLLDIDFTGGSSVTFTLKDADKMPIAEVRDALEKTELADKNLLDRRTRETAIRATRSIPASNRSTKSRRSSPKTFGDKLMTYSLEFSDLKPFTEGEFTGTEAKLSVNAGAGYTREDGISHDALREWLRDDPGRAGPRPASSRRSRIPNYRSGSSASASRSGRCGLIGSRRRRRRRACLKQLQTRNECHAAVSAWPTTSAAACRQICRPRRCWPSSSACWA